MLTKKKIIGIFAFLLLAVSFLSFNNDDNTHKEFERKSSPSSLKGNSDKGTSFIFILSGKGIQIQGTEEVNSTAFIKTSHGKTFFNFSIYSFYVSNLISSFLRDYNLFLDIFSPPLYIVFHSLIV
jgi:hypothetical protein